MQAIRRVEGEFGVRVMEGEDAVELPTALGRIGMAFDSLGRAECHSDLRSGPPEPRSRATADELIAPLGRRVAAGVGGR
jgi:hypothetical protein